MLLEMQVDSDSERILVFEVSPDALSATELEYAGDEAGVVARAKRTLTEALEDLRPSLAPILDTLQTFSPQETTLTFGLTVGGETGIIIAKGTAEVNLSVSMKWASPA